MAGGNPNPFWFLPLPLQLKLRRRAQDSVVYTARVSQVAVEVLTAQAGSARVSQVAVEVVSRAPKQLFPTFAGTSSLSAATTEYLEVGKTQFVGGTSSTSGTISLPAGVQDGDLLVLTGGDVGSTSTDPTISGGGWVVQGNTHSASGVNGVQLWVATKIASSEPGSYTITGLTTRHVVLLAFRGVTSATPDAIAHTTTGTGSATAPSVTPTQENDLEVYVVAAKGGGTWMLSASEWVGRASISNATSDEAAFARLVYRGGLTATGTVAATGGGSLPCSYNMVFKAGMPRFDGRSSLSTSVLGTHPIAPTFAGHSSLSATVFRHWGLRLSGVGHLTSRVNRKVSIKPTFAGSGSLSTSVHTAGDIRVSLTGRGSLSTNLTIHPAVRFSGTSSLSVTVTSTPPPFKNFTLTLAGTSSLAASLRKLNEISLSLAGTSSLSPTFAGELQPFTLFLQGVGQLFLGYNAPTDIDLTLSGTSTLVAGVATPGDIHVTLFGQGHLSAHFTHVQFPLRLSGFGHITFPTGVETQSVEVTQVSVEALGYGEPEVRLSQGTLEVLGTPDRSLTTAEARVSQITLEVARPWSTVRFHIRYPVSTQPD